jgi:hypothetical protein
MSLVDVIQPFALGVGVTPLTTTGNFIYSGERSETGMVSRGIKFLYIAIRRSA